MVLITEKTILFQGSRGGLTFSGGGGGGIQLFPGGILIIIFKKKHITCDFLGGGGPDLKSPLWIRTCKIAI